MEAWKEITTQLRLLSDLRDVLEKYLALSHRTQPIEAAGEDYVRRIADLLVEIQTRRTQLLVQQAGIVGDVVSAEIDGSRAVLLSSIDVLKNIASLYPPLYSPFRDLMANVEAYVTPRSRT
ncbi:MAG: hypothetical protein MUE49_13830 [Rhodospirillales bacterium]|jgi:hypothetical protein|nr:hypothetical protein [Rhodospirillales bacterium]